MKKTYLFLVSLVFSALSFSQETIENFDYGSTENDLLNVGFNWINITGGDASPSIGYLATSLIMPDYEPTAIGGAAKLNIASQPGQFGQDLHLDIVRPASTETVYLSALVNVTFARTGGSDYFLHLNSGEYLGTDENFDPIYNNENDRARIFVRDDASGGINFGILSSGESTDVSWDSNSYSKAVTYLIVAAYEIASGTSKLYVLSTPIANEPAQANASHLFPGLLEITAVSLRQKAYSPSATIDALRVATNWSDIMALETVSITDSNFENYLETHNANGDVVSMGDITSMGDGVLNNLTLSSKVETVTNLNVNDSSISSLQGIEAFTNLESLFCQRNQLQSLDVSQNLALEELECESNQFSTLDVSNNSALKVLGCSDNNLSSLDVSNNLLLESIWFPNNNITDLNLDINTALRTYGLSNNPLVYMSMRNGNNANVIYIEAQNLPSLTCIQVDDENASYLTSWNVDPNITFSEVCATVYLPDTNFENYLETHNAIGDLVALGDASSMGDGVLNNLTLISKVAGITELVVSENNIASLEGIETFTNLEILHCRANQLEVLDVSQNLALVELECESNQFSTLDLSNNTALKVLGCSDNNLSSLDVSNNLLLEAIWFPNNNITSLNLDVNTALRTYGLSNNPLVYMSMKNGNNANMLYIEAQGLPSLTCIQVDDENASYLTSWNVDPSITFGEDCGDTWTVYTSDTNVDSVLSSYGSAIDTSGDGEITLDEAAAYAGALDLSGQGIIDIQGLQAFTSVTEINLSGNNISDLSALFGSNAVILTNKSAQLKAVANSSFNSLLVLDVSNNSLVSLDLSDISTLIELDCSNNSLNSLNVKNGNNAILVTFEASNNTSLTCIQVDNAGDATSGVGPYSAWNKDSSAIYSGNCSSSLSIDYKASISSISIYPNPVKNSIYLKTNSIINKVKIYNLLGEKIEEFKELSLKNNQIDVSVYSSGFYILNVEMDGKIQSLRFIKE